MECHLPVADVDGVTIAVLLADHDKRNHMGLLLHPADENDLTDPNIEMYYTGWSLMEPEGGQRLCRIALLGDDLYNLRFRSQRLEPKWKNIVIRAWPHPGAVHNVLHPFMLSGVDSVSMEVLEVMKGVPFSIPEWLVDSLNALSFFPVVGMTGSETAHRITLQFNETTIGESLFIQLGVCMTSRAHWAQANIVHAGSNVPDYNEPRHQCDGDHVDNWPDRQKVFESEGRRLKLTFVPCPHRPHSTRVLYLDLEGTVYEELQEKRGVHIRSPTTVKNVRPPHGHLDTPASDLPVLRLSTNAESSQDMGTSVTRWLIRHCRVPCIRIPGLHRREGANSGEPVMHGGARERTAGPC